MNDMRQLVPSPVGGLPTVPGQTYIESSDDRLDLSGTISFFRRRFKLISAVVMLALAAGLAISLLSEKIFTARATVMLTNEAENTIAAASPERGMTLSSELVDTQVEIVRSRAMAEKVAAALGISNGLQGNEYRDEIDRFQRNVSAERSGKSYAIDINFDAPGPDEAANVVNEYARQFAGWDLKTHQERNSTTRRLVEERLGRLREQAQADTQALQQFRIENDLLSMTGASLAEQQIQNYNQEATRLRAEAVADQARLRTALDQLRSGSVGDDVGEALGSPVISALRVREAETAAQAADLAKKYGSNHPELIQVRGRLSEIQAQIQTEISRIMSNLEARENVSSQRLAAIDQNVATAHQKLTRNNSAMVGLSELERAAEASQGVYEAYLNRYRALLAAEGSENPNAQILTLAETPRFAHKPNLKLNLVLSLIIGLGLGIIVAYIAESFFHGLLSPEEVERRLGERHLGSIPLLKSVAPNARDAITAIKEHPNSVFVESLRTVDIAINQIGSGNKQILAITSALPGEGKTLTACCLAYILAQSGQRTILIDCDLRQRGTSRLMDLQGCQGGLMDYLEGTPFEKLDEMDPDKLFWVLPLRCPVRTDMPNPELLFTGKSFQNLLEELRGRFDRIILDLPPVLPLASTPVIASRADATIMIARWRKTSTFAIRAALRRLPPEQVNLLGVVLNQVDVRRRMLFGRGDPSFYYPKYQGYYE
jgi:succinoglycan biosynthesis transport protein ExoP